MADEPNLEGLLLLLHALKAEGRTPTVVARSAWPYGFEQSGRDYVMVEDVTYAAWRAAGYPR